MSGCLGRLRDRAKVLRKALAGTPHIFRGTKTCVAILCGTYGSYMVYNWFLYIYIVSMGIPGS